MPAIPAGFDFKLKVEELRNALLDKHPRMPTLLQEIHQALQAQPEQVTLATEEELAVIIEGLKVQTGVEFAKAAVSGKNSAATKSKLKQANIADML